MGQEISPKLFAAKGERIYHRLLRSRKLTRNHRGEIVVIDLQTGDYFLGRSVLEATEKGRRKHPGKIFYAKRVGYDAVHSVKIASYLTLMG